MLDRLDGIPRRTVCSDRSSVDALVRLTDLERIERMRGNRSSSDLLFGKTRLTV